MTSPDIYRRARDIFLECVEREESEREDILTRVRANSLEIWELVRQLLKDDAQESSFLSQGLPVGPLDTFESLTPPSIGPYRILREIGSGSSARVYLARNPRIERDVALKVIRFRRDEASRAKRFDRETQTLAQLRHPGLPLLFDAGREGAEGLTYAWMAMEFVNGQTLTTFAASLSFEGKIDLVAKLCDVVGFVHGHGIVHRDLKPQNILVASDGEPRVLDFGIAGLIESKTKLRASLTGTSDVLGTLAYMSPEQITGIKSGSDLRSDVYSLGVILHELLTGRHPYSLKGLSLEQAVERVRCGHLKSPAIRRWAPELRAIVESALASRPFERYQSAMALGQDLRAFLAGGGIQAKRTPLAKRAVRALLVRRSYLAGAVLCLCLLWVGWLKAQATQVHAKDVRAFQRLVRSLTKAAILAGNSVDLAELLSLGPDLPPGSAGVEALRSSAVACLGDLKLQEAETLFRQEWLLAQEPAVDEVSRRLANADLGMFLVVHRGSTPESRKLLGDVRAAGFSSNENWVRARVELGWSMVLRQDERFDEAVQVLSAAEDFAHQLNLGDGLMELKLKAFRARALAEGGRHQEAEQCARECVFALQSNFPSNHRLIQLAALSLGRAQLKLGSTNPDYCERAQATLRDVVQTRDELFDEGHPGRLAARRWLAEALWLGNQRSEAIDMLEEALISSRDLGEDHFELRDAMQLLARIQ